MVYLAILLILTGLLIILVTLFLETRKVNERIDDLSGNKIPDKIFPQPKEESSPDFESPHLDFSVYDDDIFEIDDNLHNSEDDIFISFDDSDESADILFDESDNKSEDNNYFDDSPFSDQERQKDGNGVMEEGKTGNEPAEVVMFEDNSGVIDYDSGVGIIDPGFSGYKKIKRVGIGELILDRDGLNFYVEDRLYRFDFHRISRIFTGENYFAFPVKDGGAVRLFIFEKGNGLIENIRDFFYNSKKD